MGRTQSPSLFTLRRFLHKVRKLGQGEALIDEFARTYLQSGLAAWGVMYIDGHFLPYYGLYPISKGAGNDHRYTSRDRKSTRLNSSHGSISYAVFCLKKKKTKKDHRTNK